MTSVSLPLQLEKRTLHILSCLYANRDSSHLTATPPKLYKMGPTPALIRIQNDTRQTVKLPPISIPYQNQHQHLQQDHARPPSSSSNQYAQLHPFRLQTWMVPTTVSWPNEARHSTRPVTLKAGDSAIHRSCTPIYHHLG